MNIREKLNNEYIKNEKELKKIEKKLYYLKENSFDKRLLEKSSWAAFPAIALMMVLTLCKIPTAENIMFLNTINIIVPIVIGLLGEKIVNKRLKIKETLSSLSNAKTEQERLEEIIKYTKEKEKIHNINKSLIKSIDLLNSDSKSLEDINDKSLEEYIDKYNKKIDVISTKHILDTEFYNFKDIPSNIMNLIIASMFTIVFTMMYFNFTYLFTELVPSTFQLFILPLLTSTLVFGGGLKRMITRKKIFNKVNNELKENEIYKSIGITKKNEKEFDYKKEINNCIENLAIARVKLEEEIEKNKVKEQKEEIKENNYEKEIKKENNKRAIFEDGPKLKKQKR